MPKKKPQNQGNADASSSDHESDEWNTSDFEEYEFDDDEYASDADDEMEDLSSRLDFTAVDDSNYQDYLYWLYNYLSTQPPQLQAASELLEKLPTLVNYLNTPISTTAINDASVINLPQQAPLLVLMVAELNLKSVEWLLEHKAEQSSAFFPKIVQAMYRALNQEILKLEAEKKEFQESDEQEPDLLQNPMMIFMQSSSVLYNIMIQECQTQLNVLHQIAKRLGGQLEKNVDLRTTKPSVAMLEADRNLMFMAGMKRPISAIFELEENAPLAKKARKNLHCT